MSSTSQRSPIKPTPKQLRYLRTLAERTGTTFTTPRSIGEASRMIEAMKQRKRTFRSDVQRERREVSQDITAHRGDAAQVRRDELSGYGSTATWTNDAGEATEPRVVHCEREAFDVYCGRGSHKLGLPRSKWANPFRIGHDGTREQVIAKHRSWLPTQPHLMAALAELRGRTLGCHCTPQACHCDTLLELANTPRPTAPPAAVSVADPGKGEPHLLAGYRVGQERRMIVVQRIGGAIRVGDLPANGTGERYLVADRLSTYGELNDLLLDYNSQIAKLGVVPASPAAVGRMLERAA
jgi:Domain of unknown function (DUF4326)